MFRGYKNKVVSWVLVLTMLAAPCWCFAQQGAAEAEETKVDVSYITPNSIVAAVVSPRRVLTAPEMEMLPVEVISAAGKKELGLDPVDIVQVMAVVEPPEQGPPGFAFVIQLAKPTQLDALKLPPDMRLEEAELDGRPYRRSPSPMVPGFYMPDEQTLIVATDPMLRKMLANRKNPVAGALSRLMARTDTSADLSVVVVVEPIRPMLSAQMANAPLPPPLAGLKRVPDLLDAAKFDVSMTGTPGMSLILVSPDEASAEELQALLNQLLDMGQQIAVAQVAEGMQSDDPVEQAGAQYAQRMSRSIVEMFRPQRNGRVLRVAQSGQMQGQVATMGVLVALLLPAVQAAREAARRTSSMNNLKQIALAMHNYHDTHRTFPPRASVDADGKPLLSWRVHILPFLDQAQLYEQFHLDEPWDSEHNLPLVERIPAVYRNPSAASPPGHADYLVPAGPGAIFASDKGTSIRNITDGTSNTILTVEANSDASVIWTKPEDLEFDPDRPMVGLGSAHPGGFLAALADGSVRFISKEIDLQTFLHLLMMSDGTPIGPF